MFYIYVVVVVIELMFYVHGKHLSIPTHLNPIVLRKAKIAYPIALRKAKIVCNFGLSERNRINSYM